MKTLMPVITLTATLICFNASAMEQTITYHKATQPDAKHILYVINEHGIKDRDKIVILPENFREGAINQAILNSRLYCAKKGSDNVVAFKKLFIIKDIVELNDITENEIRCHGQNNNFVDARIIDPINTKINYLSDKQVPSFSHSNSVVIYFGGDYTIPSHRNQKINSHLTNYSFEEIKNDTIAIIQKNNLRQIVLLYGLTKANAGETIDGIDRTPSIIKAFKQFINTIAVQCNYKTNTPLYLSRYKAFMPTFDPEATECKPLPDDQAIPGYGNVIIFPLTT
jgi:hypothetical protein